MYRNVLKYFQGQTQHTGIMFLILYKLINYVRFTYGFDLSFRLQMMNQTASFFMFLLHIKGKTEDPNQRV
jgi:hypothetical protein